jgi:hypothetical protein
MPKKVSPNLKEFHEEFSDVVEYIATYGLDSLTDQERVYAKKLAVICSEYVEVFEEESVEELTDEEEE